MNKNYSKEDRIADGPMTFLIGRNISEPSMQYILSKEL